MKKKKVENFSQVALKLRQAARPEGSGEGERARIVRGVKGVSAWGGEGHSIANIKVFLDLGASKVPVDEVTSEAPNPT